MTPFACVIEFKPLSLGERTPSVYTLSLRAAGKRCSTLRLNRLTSQAILQPCYTPPQSRRHLRSHESGNDDKPYVMSFGSDSSSDGSSEGPSTLQDTPSRPTAIKRKRASTEGNTKQTTSGPGSQRVRQYYTMKCLTGIRYRQDLDPKCPNYIEHQKATELRVHVLDLNTFTQQVRSQLNADMDHNCDPMGIQGSRGALFKITLASHGYTFVAKGTVKIYHSDLLHQCEVHEHLFSLQGSAIPVHFGNLDLYYPYCYDVGVKIYHMLMMSWGGLSLYIQTPSVTFYALEQKKRRSLRAVSRLSAVHDDWRLPNMLSNEETQRVLVIGFERSRIRRHIRGRGDRLGPSLQLPPTKKTGVQTIG